MRHVTNFLLGVGIMGAFFGLFFLMFWFAKWVLITIVLVGYALMLCTLLYLLGAKSKDIWANRRKP